MNSRLNKWPRPKLIALIAIILTAGGWWLGRSESFFHKDLGNGVIIYADDYVETGKWFFDCIHGRLISRSSLPAPLEELTALGKITRVFDALESDEHERAEALKFINALETKDYEALQYLYSTFDDSNTLRFHTFYLLKAHAGRTWVAEITQVIWRSGNRFYATAKPYDAITYVDHEKALKAAAVSCPRPQ